MSLREVRVWVASGKMSFCKGIRPCSNGSRRGWMYGGGVVDCGGGAGVEEVDGVEGSVMVNLREDGYGKECNNYR